MSVIDEFPFPFHKPAGQQLWRVMAGLYSMQPDAIAFAASHEIDPLDLQPNLSTRQLWYVLLEKAAIKGTTREMVIRARDDHKRNQFAQFLAALIDDKPAAVSPEPMTGFDPKVTEQESLLFTDDLTMAAGRIPELIVTLQMLMTLTPSVCLLDVTGPAGNFFGTGFRIGDDLLLTNEHVLYPGGAKATAVIAKFGFDVDRAGGDTPVISRPGDTATIVGLAADDWGVIRVANMDAVWPVIDLKDADVPQVGHRAYIIQHPGGNRKKIGFVRNTITKVSDQYVEYLTDTQPGSSGSPVFDPAGKLVALHHRGGTPTQLTGASPLTKNQGVRISRVYAGLKANGILA